MTRCEPFTDGRCSPLSFWDIYTHGAPYPVQQRHSNRWWECVEAHTTCYTLAPLPTVCASRGRFVGGVWRSA